MTLKTSHRRYRDSGSATARHDAGPLARPIALLPAEAYALSRARTKRAKDHVERLIAERVRRDAEAACACETHDAAENSIARSRSSGTSENFRAPHDPRADERAESEALADRLANAWRTPITPNTDGE